jgi:leader peptidase (prepilin peptidase)/N-methyltransferase
MVTGLLVLFGVCFGSFLNVLIYRLPLSQNVAFPSSHCLTCKTPLRWYHNIPVLSWLVLRGRCATCKSPISAQYPLVELGAGMLFFAVALKEEGVAESLILGLLFSLLLALSVIDLRYKAVPDGLSFPALGLAFFSGNMLLSLEHGLMFAGGAALLRMVVSSLTKKEAMGEADIIIAAIMGAVLGITLGLLAVYMAALLALVAFFFLKQKGSELPFIPFLTCGMLLAYLFETPLLGLMEAIYG